MGDVIGNIAVHSEERIAPTSGEARAELVDDIRLTRPDVDPVVKDGITKQDNMRHGYSPQKVWFQRFKWLMVKLSRMAVASLMIRARSQAHRVLK